MFFAKLIIQKILFDLTFDAANFNRSRKIKPLDWETFKNSINNLLTGFSVITQLA